jgi:membrane protease subunit HflK
MSTVTLNLPPKLRKILKSWRSIVAILFLAIILWLTIFQIGTEEVGVITRFGKYVRQVEPGLNLKIPFAEVVYKVPVERQQKLEFGFRTTKAGVNTQYSQSSSTKDESLMLTGDLNLAEVEWVVQYRVG